MTGCPKADDAPLDAPVNVVGSGTADDLRIAELLLGNPLPSISGGPIAYVTLPVHERTVSR